MIELIVLGFWTFCPALYLAYRVQCIRPTRCIRQVLNRDGQLIHCRYFAKRGAGLRIAAEAQSRGAMRMDCGATEGCGHGVRGTKVAGLPIRRLRTYKLLRSQNTRCFGREMTRCDGCAGTKYRECGTRYHGREITRYNDENTKYHKCGTRYHGREMTTRT